MVGSVDWRRGELDDIVACAGPGLPPEASKSAPLPIKIRATPAGRLVLNAVVAKLAKGFVAAGRLDNFASAL